MNSNLIKLCPVCILYFSEKRQKIEDIKRNIKDAILVSTVSSARHKRACAAANDDERMREAKVCEQRTAASLCLRIAGARAQAHSLAAQRMLDASC